MPCGKMFRFAVRLQPTGAVVCLARSSPGMDEVTVVGGASDGETLAIVSAARGSLRGEEAAT